MVETVNREQVKSMLDQDDVTVIEALPQKYFEQRHIPGAININHDEVAEKADEHLPNKQAKIITYCADESCPSSEKAAEKLESMGYENVMEYPGGKEDWQSAGEPLEAAA